MLNIIRHGSSFHLVIKSHDIQRHKTERRTIESSQFRGFNLAGTENNRLKGTIDYGLAFSSISLTKVKQKVYQLPANLKLQGNVNLRCNHDGFQ